MLYSDLPGIYIIGYVPYVGFATYRHATVMTRLCLKKKKRGRHIYTRGKLFPRHLK